MEAKNKRDIARICSRLDIRNASLVQDVIDLTAKFTQEKRTFTGHTILEQIQKGGKYPTTATVLAIVRLTQCLFDSHDPIFEGYTSFWVHQPQGPVVYFPIPKEVVDLQNLWKPATR